MAGCTSCEAPYSISSAPQNKAPCQQQAGKVEGGHTAALAKIAGSDFRQSKIKPGRADRAAIPGSLNPASPSAYEFTIAFRLFSGITRTFLLAGLALNIIFSPVKGLIPSRAFVAGFFTTFIFSRPGMVKRPLLFRLFLITPLSESKTPPICLRDSPVSLEI